MSKRRCRQTRTSSSQSLFFRAQPVILIYFFARKRLATSAVNCFIKQAFAQNVSEECRFLRNRGRAYSYARARAPRSNGVRSLTDSSVQALGIYTTNKEQNKPRKKNPCSSLLATIANSIASASVPRRSPARSSFVPENSLRRIFMRPRGRAFLRLHTRTHTHTSTQTARVVIEGPLSTTTNARPFRTVEHLQLSRARKRATTVPHRM